MDRIYSEIIAEDDHTTKRRVSSILKVPRTPLRELMSGNECIQGCDIEKRQKNSRRVSFADTIRVFPADLQTNEETVAARHQEPFDQKEKPETVQCEITEMDTLLHAPIQTPLQQMESHGQEWNKMSRTLLFSEENEMDMTSGHTVMITHDIGIYEETDKSRKIDFKSFSAELKPNKENSEVNEFSSLHGPVQGNETSPSQQKTNIGNTKKIKFDDFLESLKSTKFFPTPAAEVSFLPSEVPERKPYSSEMNASFQMQGKSIIAKVSEGLDNKTAGPQYCLSNEKTIAPLTSHASKQMRCGAVAVQCRDESMDKTISNTERVMSAGFGSLTVAKQHQNLESDYSVSYDSCRSKPSSHPPHIQQLQEMCVNKTTVNNREAGISPKHAKLISSDYSLFSYQEMSVTQKSFGSVPVLHGNKNTVSSNIYSDMNVTRNQNFISDANSKEISKCVHRTAEKQNKTASGLMERIVLSGSNMDAMENQVSTNANMNGMPHSINCNEMAASKQKGVYGNKELQNLSIKPGSSPSSHLERKEDTLLVSLPSDTSAVFSAKSIDLSRNYVARREAKQVECQSLLSDEKAAFAELNGKTVVNYTTKRKSSCSDNGMPPVPADKTLTFTVSEDMELTKPTVYLIDKSLKTAGFYKKPQEETRSGNYNVIGPTGNKTVVFSLEDNEMEITKSCTVAVNHNFMQPCERDPHLLQPVDKTVYTLHNDIDLTESNTCIIDQSLENAGARAVHKLLNKADRKTCTKSTKDKTKVVFSLSDENEMEITRSHTVALNYGDAPQGGIIPTAMHVAPDKTVMVTFSEDMEMTRPVAGAMDKSLRRVTGTPAVPQQATGTGKKSIPGIISDKTVVFSLGEGNEMEITKSCIVALNHNVRQHCETVPQALPLKSVDKTVYISHNEKDKTQPISSIIGQSLENVIARDNKADGRTPIGSTRDKTVVFSLSEHNEMEITSSHTLAANHDTAPQIEVVPQEPGSFPAEKSFRQVFNSNMAVNRSSHFIPADKIKMLIYNNDIEISNPIEHVTNSSQKNKEKGIDKITLPGFVNEEKFKFLLCEDNEMEITKSHTVAVNHDIQQMEGAQQELSLISAKKTKLSGHNDNTATSFVPAGKTLMQMHRNDMEITESLTDKSLKNISSKTLPLKGKEIHQAMLSGPVKCNAILKPHDNEMEITKCLTVEVDHDIFSQCERRLPVQFCQDSMDITGSCNDMKSMHANTVALGKESKWEASANQMLALATGDNIESAKRHTVPMNHQTAQQHQSVSKAGLLIPSSKSSVFACFQDGKEITMLLPDATADPSLNEKQAPNRNTKQVLGNMSFFTNHGITQDIDITRNHTVHIYSPSCYVPNPEKPGLNFATKSRENTIAYSDGETMEMTRNHTIGVEFMDINNCNKELSSCSQAEFHSKCSPLDVPHGKELGITKTDKYMPEKSVSSSHVELSMPVNDVNRQNLVRIQENQLESHTSRINRLSEAANYVHCREEHESMLLAEMPVQHLELYDVTTLNSSRESMSMLVNESRTSKDYPEKGFLSRHESNPAGVTENLPFAETATKMDRAVLFQPDQVTKDWQNNLGPPVNNLCSEKDLALQPEVPSIINDCSKITDIGKKLELGLKSQNSKPNLREELKKPKDPLELTEDIRIKSTNSVVSNELKNNSSTECDPFSVPFNNMQKNPCQIKKVPLGIFPPKLPNKRKLTVSNVEDIGERTEAQDSEHSLLIKKFSGQTAQHLSPSHYISEESLPPCLEEVDSSELLNSELQEKVCDVMDEKEVPDGRHLKGTNKQKRFQNKEGEELQKEKKLKVDEGWCGTTELKPLFSSTIVVNEEILEGKNKQDMMASNMEKTPSSNGSCLDSVKADSDLSIPQNVDMEAELMNSSCEQNLYEKLQDGVITVGEFFTLLQVDIVIQKPRQSLLPPKYMVNDSPTPEDLLLTEYVYAPKLQIYNEDCQALSKILEELKLCADNKDKLLVNVNKSLWEVMRTCSIEELKAFGAELNKMKSYFVKKSKVLAHRRKEKMYLKLVHSAQLQWEKLQSRLNEMDELLEEMDNCLVALEAETTKFEEFELEVNDSVAEYETKLRQTEQELENCKAQEEALQRDQSNLRDQQQQKVSEINRLQEEVKSCQELMEKYNFSEWVMKEWSDQQAVFTFLYDSIKLTVALEHLGDTAVFTTKTFCRKIIGVNVESLLDEAKAPASSKLVQRLIFQFINDQTSRQEKHLEVQHLRQLLHDISLVVSRCQLLGEEIEFLNRWGGKFNLLKTAVNDTKVKLLFSSSLVFAKFEVELSLSANYPVSPMAFTVQKHRGNLGQEEISEVLSSIPVGADYLKRMVNQIHHCLLQNPSRIHRQQK
ncbi:kinetochore scaffold 1 [Sphaerodactylus townsendi]|uniref:kinetochore scaffold 1 n=1 Tax=Sphaerodactylus townsendi TaxID=933632 RepID=UPI0020265350|nr:kinetochore scaffold 1 [Sphaerodactylus townsendi]XP_048340785.1 kinetochore scaffold 1 [Sphaerodactylus townsendi]